MADPKAAPTTPQAPASAIPWWVKLGLAAAAGWWAYGKITGKKLSLSSLLESKPRQRVLREYHIEDSKNARR